MAKKITDDEIDEDFIIASMNTIVPGAVKKKEPEKKEEPEEVEPSQNISAIQDKPTGLPKEEPRKKKGKADYESMFIRETNVTGRKEKTTYLRSKFYRKIQDIILCYDNTNLSVFGYIDAVLSHHFEMYDENIREILKRRYEES